jgi:hypothetical protein
LEITYCSVKSVIGTRETKRNDSQTKTHEQARRIQKLLKGRRAKASGKIKLTQTQPIPKQKHRGTGN